MTSKGAKNNTTIVPTGKYSVGYARVSSDEQARSGLSIEFQEQKIREYAQFKDIKDIRIIKDEGKSAKNLNRPGMNQIREWIKKGQLDTLVVYKLDRLTRSVKDLTELIELFEKKNVKFISISESWDTSTAQGKLMFNFVGAIAQWERQVISERTQDALNIKKQRKEKLGGIIPYGYKVIDTKKFNKKGETIKVLAPIKEEQRVINIIKGLRKNNKSTPFISDYLNKRKIKTKNDTKWYPSTVNQILKREGVK